MDRWRFVSCNCSDVGQHGRPSVDCLALEGNTSALRVLSLNLPARISGAHYVSGILSPGLAGLTELRTLHVAGQNLQVGPLGSLVPAKMSSSCEWTSGQA